MKRSFLSLLPAITMCLLLLGSAHRVQAVVVTNTTLGQTLFDSNGFEKDTTGASPKSCGAGSWTSGTTPQDAVTTAASPGPFSGSNYLVTNRDNTKAGNPHAKFSKNQTTHGHQIHIEWYMWLPAGGDHSLILHNNSTYYRAVGRLTGGKVLSYDSASYVPTGAAYAPDRWNKFEIDYTIGADSYSIKVNDISNGMCKTLDGLDKLGGGSVDGLMFGHNGNDTYYIDGVMAKPTALVAATSAAVGGEAGFSPQPPDQLKPMLKITWSRGPNLPQGYQDSEGGFIGDTLVSVGGFCSGEKEDNARKPGVYPRGFLKKAWGLEVTAKQGDVSTKPGQWHNLPDFPGAARQGMVGGIVNEQLYVWGGFNYDQPFTYDDGWKLSKTGAGWSWSALPKLPWKLTGASATVIDTQIYVFGGADYDGVNGAYTETDREKKMPRLGARLLVFDTKSPDAGWKELPLCPGSPRYVHAMQAVKGKIYIVGGATGLPTYTVVDNWVFEPASERWTRLRDLPIASGNFPKGSNLLFQDRYILLPGGYQYSEVINIDGTTRPPYGKPNNLNKGTGLFNDVFVYDIQTDTFGTADRMPIDNNLPMTVVRGDRIYMLGGETGGGVVEGEFYGHHPDLLLIGRLETLSP